MRRIGICVLATTLATPALAEAVTDGTVGARVHLSGDFEVGAELGRQAGHNLFHSFERFSLRSGERATFSGPGDVRNIISRVTGGARSDIDGTIRSTIAGADFYFINPAGVLFGPNASLDVQGSFHVSTADDLRFADGARFSATDPAASSFTVAAPEAFGFLGGRPAPITLDDSHLAVPVGKTLSLVGGDLTIDGPGMPAGPPSLAANEGAVRLVALGSGGTVAVATGEPDARTLGRVRIRDGAIVQSGGTGVIRISANDLTVAGRSLLDASTAGSAPTDGVVIRLSGELLLRHSLISADAFGAGTARGIDIAADRITIDGGQIDASAFGSGGAGSIVLRAKGGVTIGGTPLADQPGIGVDAGILEPRAGIYAATRGFGLPGGIVIEAHEIALRGGLISGITRGFGGASSISLRADSMRISEAGAVSAETFSLGSGGALTIRAPVLLSVDNGFIGADSREGATGPSGTVTVRAGRLVFVNEGRIFNGTNSVGGAGAVFIEADTILIDGRVDHEAQFRTGITATAEASSFNAGVPTISVAARRIEIVNGGRIAASSGGFGAAGNVLVTATEAISIRGSGVSGPSDISVAAENASTQADVGNIVIAAPLVELADGGRIEASNAGLGRSGGVTIQADRMQLENGASITAASDRVDAGDIVLLVGRLVDLDRSTITTSAARGQGGGGNILIDPRFVVLDRSDIVANAAQGIGGNIRIVADNFVATSDSRVDASSERGIDGTVAISSPETDLSAGLVVLEGAIIDTAPLRARCGARRDIGASSFTGVGRGGLPPGPDSPLSSTYPSVGAAGEAELADPAGLPASFEPATGVAGPCLGAP